VLFVPDAAFVAELSGRVFAARDVLHGADPIAQVLVGITRKAVPRVKYAVSYVGEEPALIGWFDDAPFSVSMIDARCVGDPLAVSRVLNPEKLGRVSRALS
jgi:hypothetical protein